MTLFEDFLKGINAVHVSVQTAVETIALDVKLVKLNLVRTKIDFHYLKPNYRKNG